jgi:serine/threonine-protein kinase HipA
VNHPQFQPQVAPYRSRALARYGCRYLQRKGRLALDPVQLPLHEADVDRDYSAPEGFVLFNGIHDAAPDGWGRHVMAERVGFEPTVEFPQHTLSKRAP